MDYVIIFSRAVLALVFVASSLGKLRDRAAFRSFVVSLLRLEPLPGRWARPVAGAVVTVEAAIPVLLIVPSTVVGGFVLAGCALIAFSVAIGTAIRRNTNIPCKCFGASGTSLGGRHLVRNGALLVVAVTGGLIAQFGEPGSRLSEPGSVHPGGALVVLTAAGCVAALVVRFDDLAGLFAQQPAPARATARPAAARRTSAPGDRP
ncbi:MauE/DoxX family redox-associated membrane protein [Actinomadura sp. HBU206391]|uniref:MauE/DoxX family redox-associated membrane protein n=1 Tax=Actinomadura sp. HBU206391 TaxID=2731692 RepID=UPI00164F3FF2|nr:MauE/DoxX family redox-associated membrane protein [Actinomadura sp. HBU206391]MBC6459730.1 methylamine utilization protein MauE [Actinomadura sp. HBU206391]